MILLILSFVAGILTVLAPCTLPLLPVIIGGSVSDSSVGRFKRPLVITASLSLSIIVFTFLLKVSTVFIYVPPWTWTLISGGILIIFGLISIFPSVWEKLPLVGTLSTRSNRVLGAGYQKKSVLGDIIIGAALGPVFSTCSPTYFVILATVLPQSFLMGLVDLIAYTVGLSLSLLVIAFLGQKIVGRLEGVSDPHGWFKKGLGVLFLVVGLAVLSGYDKVLEKNILDVGFFDITKVEQKLLRFQESGVNNPEEALLLAPETVGSSTDSQDTGSENIANGSSRSEVSTSTSKTVTSKFDSSKITSKGKLASEIVFPSGFINTDNKPVSIASYRHKKVVLLDIWTYSCINCQRTIPYITAWYDKYKDQGLEIIGLHTPEFGFEKVKANVEEAVRKFGITYPVVLDNQYATWNAYGNNFWPRKYLINANGQIVYDHIGEGDYEETEKEIQKALIELHNALGDNTVVPTGLTKPANAVVSDISRVGSPEVYFGSDRNEYLANGPAHVPGEYSFVFKSSDLTDPSYNKLYLEGLYDIQKDRAVAKGPARILFKYRAKDVYMVLSGGGQKITIIPYLDDVRQSPIEVGSNQLYQIVKGTEYGGHTLRIEIQSAGLEAYTFTFG